MCGLGLGALLSSCYFGFDLDLAALNQSRSLGFLQYCAVLWAFIVENEPHPSRIRGLQQKCIRICRHRTAFGRSRSSKTLGDAAT